MQHELEHVRRRDCLVDALARLTCAFYWFHPLAWLCWHRLRFEAERACDDAVLLRESDAIGYAEQLVSLATQVTTAQTPLLAMAGGRDLARRVHAVLDGTQERGRAGRWWMTTVAAAALVFVGLIAPLSAGWQVKTPAGIAFEIASIKENTSGDPAAGGNAMLMRIDPGGRFTARNVTLRNLVLLAYRFEITAAQLGPLDGWMERRRFDIDARAGDGVIAAIDRNAAQTMDRMLQTLLADRFKLRVRRDTKIGDVYVLAIADGGLKAKPSVNAEACAGGAPLAPRGVEGLNADSHRLTPLANGLLPCHLFTRFGRRGFEAIAVDSWDVAGVLREIVHAPVEDRATIAALFDASVTWNSDPLRNGNRDASSGPEPQPADDDPDVPTALREQLGLTLDRHRAPVETLIVEFAQPPAAN
jgi:uncharacterized protein (TIGR03435 family)